MRLIFAFVAAALSVGSAFAQIGPSGGGKTSVTCPAVSPLVPFAISCAVTNAQNLPVFPATGVNATSGGLVMGADAILMMPDGSTFTSSGHAIYSNTKFFGDSFGLGGGTPLFAFYDVFSNAFSLPVGIYAPSLPIGGTVAFALGRDNGTLAFLGMKYVGPGSALNAFSLGFFGDSFSPFFADYGNNFVAGHVGGALGTGATSGFFWTPSMAGTPTGVPAATGAYPGSIPTVVDTTNVKVCWYIGGAWKCLSPT